MRGRGRGVAGSKVFLGEHVSVAGIDTGRLEGLLDGFSLHRTGACTYIDTDDVVFRDGLPNVHERVALVDVSS
jgi:hypothetical protein